MHSNMVQYFLREAENWQGDVGARLRIIYKMSVDCIVHTWSLNFNSDLGRVGTVTLASAGSNLYAYMQSQQLLMNGMGYGQ